MQPPILNIAAYHFVDIDKLPERRQALRDTTVWLGLKGSILLSEEGINLFLAGTQSAIHEFIAYLHDDPLFIDLNMQHVVFKQSWSQEQPFSRMLVKLKKEIIPLGMLDIRPKQHTAPTISPHTLKQWLDEGRDFTLLDTRNDYEVRVGTFDNAVTLDLQQFRDFPQVCREQLPDEVKHKPLVMFCTGGIRCEKASVALEKQGHDEIYQLDGGILNYFEQCGGAHYHGECFVFDKRVALDPALAEAGTTQCYCCQNPLSIAEQQSPQYVPGQSCPYCFHQKQATNNDLSDSQTV